MSASRKDRGLDNGPNATHWELTPAGMIQPARLRLAAWDDLGYKLLNQVHLAPPFQHGSSRGGFTAEDWLQLLKQGPIMFFQLTLTAMTQGRHPGRQNREEPGKFSTFSWAYLTGKTNEE